MTQILFEMDDIYNINQIIVDDPIIYLIRVETFILL